MKAFVHVCVSVFLNIISHKSIHFLHFCVNPTKTLENFVHLIIFFSGEENKKAMG